MASEIGTATATADVRTIIEPIFRAKFWMQLIGVMLIISGVLTALSIIGIVIAWVPIWAGWVLMQAAGASDRAYNQNDHHEASYAMTRLRTYFTIFGVLMLIYICVTILFLVFGVGMGMMQQMQQF